MVRHPVLRGLWAVLLCGSVTVAQAAAKKPAPPPAPEKAAAPAKPAPPEPEERVIERSDGDYVLRLTLRPGNLKPNRVAQGDVEIIRKLQIPDPVTGDQMPIAGIQPVSSVKPPEPPPGKGHAEQAPTISYFLWPTANPGGYAFHFTPKEDGIHELSISGTEAAKAGEEETESRSFKVTYRIGVGTAAAQTEQNQGGTAMRRTTRRPIGGDTMAEKEKKLVKLMRDVGDHFMALDAGKDAAAEAHAVSTLIAQAKGLAPDQGSGDPAEFDRLAFKAGQTFEEFSTAVAAKNAKTKPSLDAAESAGCTQCHAKYRFQITDDLSSWPKFAQKAVGQ